MGSISCKNCERNFEGKFCPHCGQKAETHKIDLHYFLHDIPHSVLHIDRGFFYTLNQLSRRPGDMMVEYLGGKRVDHFKPVAFVIIMSTICTIITNLLRQHFLNTDPKDFPFFAKYPSLLIFLLIPVISMISWLCFFRRKYNYWEHLLINTYLGAFLNVFLLLVTAIRVIIHIWNINASMFFITMIMMFLFMTYYSFTYGAMMHEKGKWARNAVLLSLMDGLIATVYFMSFAFTGITRFW